MGGNIHFPTTYKYAAGSVFATAAVLSSVFIDKAIKATYDKTGEQISVFWMAIPYFLVGMGEVLTNSASYDTSFRIAPKEQKGLASVINLFMMGSFPGFINNGIVKTTKAYVDSRIGDYFWILVALALIFGVGVNLLPPVKNFVENTVNNAIDATKIEFSQMGDDSFDEDSDKSIESSEDGENGVGTDDDDMEEVRIQ